MVFSAYQKRKLKKTNSENYSSHEKKDTNETIKKVIMRNQATFNLRIFLISKGEFYKFLWLDEHFSQFFWHF